jgi:hypothetical protein
MSEGRVAIGYDTEVFSLGLALGPAYVEGFVEGCLERIGEDDSDGELFLRTSGRRAMTPTSALRP